MRRTSLFDTAGFVLALGGSLALIGGIGVSIGVAQGAPTAPDLNLWFVGGAVVLAVGVLCVLWAIVLFLAHGHAAKHAAQNVGTTAPAGVDPTASYFRQQRIHLTDLVREIDPPVLVNKTFEDCEIVGPAVLHLKDFGVLEDSFVNAPKIEAGLFTVIPGQPLIGIIVASGCTFRRCSFYRVSFAGDKEFVQRFMEATTDHLAVSPEVERQHSAVPTHGTDVRCTTCGWEGPWVKFKTHQAKAQ